MQKICFIARGRQPQQQQCHAQQCGFQRQLLVKYRRWYQFAELELQQQQCQHEQQQPGERKLCALP